MGFFFAQSMTDYTDLYLSFFVFFSFQSFLGTKKVKYVIPFDRVVKILFKAGSPPDMINNYLKLIESNEVRLKLAEEFKLS